MQISAVMILTYRRFRSLVPFAPSAPNLAIVALAATLTLSCKDKPAENTVDAAATVVVDAAVAPASSDAGAVLVTDGGDAGAHAEGRGRRGDHGGPGAMLFQAARTLDLKDEQKAKIDAAEKEAHAGAGEASRDAMKDAAKDVHAEIVAGIKAGKIDNAKLEPKYAAVDKVAAAAHAKEAEALTALHGALDATQRKAVTASVRAKHAAREEKMEDKKEERTFHKDEHAKDRIDAGGDAGALLFAQRRGIDRLTRGLDLDAEQTKKIDAIAAKDDGKSGRPDPVETKKRLETLLVAFEKDTFDAKKVDAFDAKKARGPMEQETKLLTQVLPILKPEQREKLAARMERGPSPHGRRGHGAPGRPGHQDGEDGED